MNDIRQTLRALGRSLGFTAVAVLTLALGIGANTALFSVVYGVLLRPLPYRDPSRLVFIQGQRTFDGQIVDSNYAPADLEDWQSARGLESVAIAGAWTYALSDGRESEVVDGARVSSGYFSAIGAPMALGRPLGPPDDASPAIVISHGLWQRRYAGTPDVIGRTVIISGQPYGVDGVDHSAQSYTVVGVAGAGFQLPSATIDVWVPTRFAMRGDPVLGRRGAYGFNPIARVKSGVTMAQAQAGVDEVSHALSRTSPEQYGHVRADLVPLRERLSSRLRPVLLILFAAVSLVLIVACANVANLLLARQAARGREIAIRLALGASRAQIARLSLAESGTLSLGGVLAGVLAARWLADLLVWLKPAGLTQLDAIHVDGPVLAFAAGIGVATALVVGLLPACQSSISVDALRGGPSAAGYASTGRRIRMTIAIVQLAASMVLLVGGLLLGRSLVALLDSEIGVPTDHVAQALVGASFGRMLMPAQRASLLQQLVERLASEPGIEIAAASASLPPNRTRFKVSFTLTPEGAGQPTEYLVDTVAVTPSFFQALRLPLVRGRLFTASDSADRQPVAIVSARIARRLFGDRDPIGHMIPMERTGNDARRDVAIVGVVGDVKLAALDRPADGAIYRPIAQQPLDTVFLIARTSADGASAIGAIRRAITDVDPAVAVYSIGTLEGLVAAAAAQPRLQTVLLGSLAGLALMLAGVGLYGVVAYSVTQRTGEIAIRMALGARGSDVLGMVLRQGLQLSVAGIAVGLAAAFALTRTLAALLYGIGPTDPWSFGGAVCVLLIVTLVASYLPARRATRVDPLTALRAD